MTKWLEEHYTKALLNMMRCRNKAELKATVPIFFNMAKVDKSLHLGLFQAIIDSLLDNHNIKGFSYMVTLAMFNNLLSMKWDAIYVDRL